MKSIALVLSCEHAVDTVPEAYKHRFSSYQDLLKSHRGIDFGALNITHHLQAVFGCEFVVASATRLLIDCNRSLSHPNCFSEITLSWTKEDKNQLIQNYYLPFRQNVERIIKNHIADGQFVCHLSIHSFTPILNHQVRTADIGLLYDPKRSSERVFALNWQHHLRQQAPTFRVRRNYPYRGTSDGFTAALRKQFIDKHYLGLEVESNQALTEDKKSLFDLATVLATTLQTLFLQMDVAI